MLFLGHHVLRGQREDSNSMKQVQGRSCEANAIPCARHVPPATTLSSQRDAGTPVPPSYHPSASSLPGPERRGDIATFWPVLLLSKATIFS